MNQQDCTSKSKKNFELLNLKSIFDNGGRAFLIPEYQRGYSWETRQREDLLKDIENLFVSDYTHYTGTIVASSKKEFEGCVEFFDIVDGQQRLTSLVILLAVLLHHKKLNENNTNELQTYFIGTGMETGNTLRKFSLNSLLDTYFYKFIQEKNIDNEIVSTKSHQNIYNAFNEYNKWIKIIDISHDTLYKIITERLGFLLYAPRDSAEIGIMFEVINNRGKPLSELEKIKNYLIYFSEKNRITDLRLTIDNSWGIILKNLNESGVTSNDDENSFLRNCWIVFEDTNKSRSHHVYDSLKKRFPSTDKGKWNKLKEFVLFIENASNTYRYLLSKNKLEIDEKEQVWLRNISLHASSASILPLMISIYEKVSNSTDRIRLLEFLEKLNFRYYGCGIANRADTGQGDLFLWAYRFYNYYQEEIEIGEEIQLISVTWLLENLHQFIDKHANDILFVEYLTLDKDEDYDYYGWNNIRFFLAAYEEKLRKTKGKSIDLVKMLEPQKKEAKNDYYQKEHIWARKEFTIVDDEENLDINKRRLGNFVLLEPSINISVSNDPVEKKINDYFDIMKKDVPSSYMLYELQGFYTKAEKDMPNVKRRTKKYWYELNQRFLDYREEVLINFALDRWRIKHLTKTKTITKVSIDSKHDEDRNFRYS